MLTPVTFVNDFQALRLEISPKKFRYRYLCDIASVPIKRSYS